MSFVPVAPRLPPPVLTGWRHALLALQAIVGREVFKFSRQYGRLLSALVRPLLWLVVFAAGFRNVFGVAVLEPYDTYISYDEYIAPGLIGMVLLFNGMQSSLAMVYDREMGLMRLLLTAPLPRAWVLACKLIATTVLSLIQVLAFLIVAALLGTQLPLWGWQLAHFGLALIVGALMLGSIGLLLSVHIRQLENFAGNMLEVHDRDGRSLLVMSRSAWHALDADQRRQVERHSHPLVVNIDHIERIGGGSARCMLAEVHLPSRH